MRSLSSTELSRMRSHAEETFQDTCVIQDYTAGAVDGLNQKAETWPDGSTVSCGLRILKHREVLENSETELIDARIRLPIGTSLDHRDKIKVTHRFGTALATPLIFRIVGEPVVSHSALQADLVFDNR